MIKEGNILFTNDIFKIDNEKLENDFKSYVYDYDLDIDVNNFNNLWDYFMEISNFLWDDFKNYTLPIVDKKINGKILIVANIGCWNGRRQSYKIMDSLKDFYSECEYQTYYIDRDNLKFEGCHHDGTNLYTFRELKDLSEKQFVNMEEKFYNGTFTNKDLTRYSKPIAKLFKEI